MENPAHSPSGREPEVPRCFRCGVADLAPLPSPQGAAFFRCPRCEREFFRTASGALVFRWGHPISLILYPVLFDEDPAARCAQVAALFAEQSPPEKLRQAIDEIRLELNHPAQPVREIVGCRASEAALRDFLRCVASQLDSLAG
jgi:hypothetical protein